MKTRLLLFFLLLTVVVIPTFAQLKVTINISSRPDPYISNWAQRKEIVIVTIVNSGPSAVRAKFDCKINQDGKLIANTKPEKMQIVDIPTGISQYYGESLVPFENMKINEGLDRTAVQTGMLPAGSYEFCCALLDPQNIQITEPVCKNFTIQSYQAPVLLQPDDKSTLTKNQRPMFRWTGVSPKPNFLVLYQIRVFEVLQGQTAINAFRVNKPILEQSNIPVTQFQWPADFELPNPRLQHIWTVRALDDNGNPIGEPDGYATPFVIEPCCPYNEDHRPVNCCPPDSYTDVEDGGANAKKKKNEDDKKNDTKTSIDGENPDVNKRTKNTNESDGVVTTDEDGNNDNGVKGKSTTTSSPSSANPPCVNIAPSIVIRPPTNSSMDILNGGTYNYSPLINYGSLSQNALKLVIQNQATNSSGGMIVKPCLKVYIKKGTGNTSNWVQYPITVSFDLNGGMTLQIPHNQFDIGSNQIKVETYNCPNSGQSQVKCFPDQIFTVIKEQGKWEDEIHPTCPCLRNPTAELIWWPNGVEVQPATYLQPGGVLNIPYNPTANKDKFIEIRVNPHPGKSTEGGCEPTIEVLQNGSPYINMLARNWQQMPWPLNGIPTLADCCPPGVVCTENPCPIADITAGNCYREVTVPPYLHINGPNPSKWFTGYNGLFYEGTHTYTVKIRCCGEIGCKNYKKNACETYNFTVNRLPKPKCVGDIKLTRICVCDSTSDLNFTDVPIITFGGYKYKMEGILENCKLRYYKKEGTWPNIYYDGPFEFPFIDGAFTPVMKPIVFLDVVDNFGNLVEDGCIKINGSPIIYKPSVTNYFGETYPAHHFRDYSNWKWNMLNCKCLPPEVRNPKYIKVNMNPDLKYLKKGFKINPKDPKNEYNVSIIENEGIMFENTKNGKIIQVDLANLSSSIQNIEVLKQKVRIKEIIPNNDPKKPNLSVSYSIGDAEAKIVGLDLIGITEIPNISQPQMVVTPVPGVGIVVKRHPRGKAHFIIPGVVVDEGNPENNSDKQKAQGQHIKDADIKKKKK